MRKRSLKELQAELAAMNSPVYGAKKMAHLLLKGHKNKVVNPVLKKRKAEKKHKNKGWE